MNIAQRAEICKHSTGHIGAVAVYTRPPVRTCISSKVNERTARTVDSMRRGNEPI